MNPKTSTFSRAVEAPAVSRRSFISSVVMGGAFLAASSGCSLTGSRQKATSQVAFVTANLVARVSDYRFKLGAWGEQHKKTVAATDLAAWRAICQEISAAGFRAVEVWQAHAEPGVMTRARAADWKAVMADFGLQPIGYAGSLNRQTAEICQWLGISQINGGLGGNTVAQATVICRETGIRFNTENHPEKSAADHLKVVGGGNEWLGVCVDTGWYGTQGVDAPAAIRTLGPMVRHVHIKDVKAAGGHETCLLGEGLVNIAGCIEALKDIRYFGWYAWEDEPEDRNPFDSAVRNREWIEERIG